MSVEVLEALNQRFQQGPHPFSHTVVRTPWETEVPDVESIHREVCMAILEQVEAVRRTRATCAVIIRGQPGAGKTHLLRRVRRRLPFPALYGYVHPFGDGRRIYRHILRELVQSLVQPVSGRPVPQIVAFAAYVFGRAVLDLAIEGGLRTRLTVDPLILTEIFPAMQNLAPIVETVQRRHPGVDPDVIHALLRILRHDSFPLALRWLQGADLDEGGKEALGVKGTLSVEEHALSALVSLGLLGRDFGPVVLCFDQLEFLPSVEGEPGFVALGKALANFYNQVPNCVLILSVLSRYWQEQWPLLPKSVQDRLGEHIFDLGRLTGEEIVELIATRMRLLTDGLPLPWPSYPFHPQFCHDLAMVPDVTVRDVFSYCAREFDRMRERGRISEVLRFEPAAPRIEGERPLQEVLSQELERRAHDRQGVELDEGMVTRGLELVLEAYRRSGTPLEGFSVRAVEGSPQVSRDLELSIVLEGRGGKVTVGISLCNTENPRSLAAKVERLMGLLRSKAVAKVFLLRDERLPIPEGWRRNIEHLAALEDSGGRILWMDPVSLAWIDAVRTLFAEASTGDLLYQGRPVPDRDLFHLVALLHVGTRIPLLQELFRDVGHICRERMN